MACCLDIQNVRQVVGDTELAATESASRCFCALGMTVSDRERSRFMIGSTGRLDCSREFSLYERLNGSYTPWSSRCSQKVVCAAISVYTFHRLLGGIRLES
jgi:hypothetical protein